MITPGPGLRIWVAAGVTDMRRGFDGLAALVQQQLCLDPFSGALFIFRGRRGHLLKILAWDGQGLVLYAKRLERGRFVSYGLCQAFEHASPAAGAGAERLDEHDPHR
jgi:transposase